MLKSKGNQFHYQTTTTVNWGKGKLQYIENRSYGRIIEEQPRIAFRVLLVGRRFPAGRGTSVYMNHI
jgi:hypothetical protein